MMFPTSQNRLRRIVRFLDVLLPILLLALMCGIAFAYARDAVSGIVWTDNFDSLRDVGGANSILAGRYPEDPSYLKESLWYNPFIGALVALVSWIADCDPLQADILLGPWLNLAVPILFFALVASLFDRWTALVAVAWLLFGKGADRPFWMAAVYAPWLLAGNLAQAIFFASLLAYWHTRRARWYWSVAPGILWGVAFLTHTAPAVVLGLVFLGLAVLDIWTFWRRERIKSAILPLARFFIMAAAAFLVSLPYTWPIFSKYAFKIENPWPTWYVDPFIDLKRLPQFLMEAISVSTLFGAGGLVYLCSRRGKKRRKRLVVLWLAIPLFLLAYSYVWQHFDARRVQLPHLIPGHHALLFLYAVKALLIGSGILGMIHTALVLVARIVSRKTGRAREIWGGWPRAALALLATAAVVGVSFPSFTHWPDYTRTGDKAAYNAQYEDSRRTYDWIVRSTQITDVFLCEWDLAARIVGATGRKLVANMIWYSNVYIDFQERVTAKEAMFEAIRAGDAAQFRELASQWKVAYVLAQDRAHVSNPTGHETAIEEIDGAALDCLKEVFRAGRYAVYRIAD